MKKLNILLAKTDQLGPLYKAGLNDYGKFFKGGQGAFLGLKSTYEPREGMIDEPSKRKNILVQSTVDEKLNWFTESAGDYIQSLFSQEKTNASGITAELVIDGVSWGMYTSLELLRLKDIVSNNSLGTMLATIPVKSDAEDWKPSKNEMYSERKGIFEMPLEEGVSKTTTKEQYILADPNLTDKTLNYVPQVAQKDTTVEIGAYSIQKFSGEWSQRQRASALRRRATMLTSIIEALKTCNEAEVVDSTMTADKIFGYLFNGTQEK